jgi:hypothetical protein
VTVGLAIPPCEGLALGACELGAGAPACPVGCELGACAVGSALGCELGACALGDVVWPLASVAPPVCAAAHASVASMNKVTAIIFFIKKSSTEVRANALANS